MNDPYIARAEERKGKKKKKKKKKKSPLFAVIWGPFKERERESLHSFPRDFFSFFENMGKVGERLFRDISPKGKKKLFGLRRGGGEGKIPPRFFSFDKAPFLPSLLLPAPNTNASNTFPVSLLFFPPRGDFFKGFSSLSFLRESVGRAGGRHLSSLHSLPPLFPPARKKSLDFPPADTCSPPKKEIRNIMQ